MPRIRQNSRSTGRNRTRSTSGITGYDTGAHVAAKTGVKDIYPVWVFQSSENYLACNLSLPEATADKLQKALDAMKRDGAHAAIVARYEARVKAK